MDSYRTELVGILAALGRPGAVHFGIDNHAAFEDAMAIVAKPANGIGPRKPWSLVKNGDLLKLVHEMTEKKPTIYHGNMG